MQVPVLPLCVAEVLREGGVPSRVSRNHLPKILHPEGRRQIQSTGLQVG